MFRALLVSVTLASVAAAAPPEPTGAHPRMLVDTQLVATWKSLAKLDSGPVAGAIALCNSGATAEHDRAVYMGSEWSRVLQACLVAYVATDKPEYAKTATKFFTALLDDVDRIGDGGGGDTAARRDSGYALRNLGPYTALAYDWLYAQLPESVRAKARQRWAAWLTWYRDKGYRARQAGTNYQAGYLAAATMIAVAQGGEAENKALWPFVADQLWGHDMAEALAPGGILDGGDWPEGWQYGPLSVAHYALAARIAAKAGVPVAGVQPWLHAVLQRHVYALSPSDKLYVGHDTEAETPNVAPNVLTLNAIALGDAAPADRKAARAELARLQLTDKDFFLYDALASTDTRADLVALDRTSLPTLYTVPATGALFTRTRWDAKAVWFTAECGKSLPVDHRQPKAGSFALSRGADDAIVDPSPYGSASTLTSNAATVPSPQFPSEYQPSQGLWGSSTWAYATQTKSGIVAARCDYAGAYKLQEKPTDVKLAQRDFVLLPSTDGTNAALLVVDRAQTASPTHPLNVQFHVVGGLTLANDIGEKMIGATKVTIAPLAKSSGKGVVVVPQSKDCFAKDVIKGKCTAARFEASAYHVEVAGPTPFAAHLISVDDQRSTAAATTEIKGDGINGFSMTSPRPATVVWPTAPGGSVHYVAVPGTHVVLDAPALGGMATVKATSKNGACDVTVSAGGPVKAQPLIVTLDRTCAVAPDAATKMAASAPPEAAPAVPVTQPGARSGCCDAGAGPSSPIALGILVAMFGVRRRR